MLTMEEEIINIFFETDERLKLLGNSIELKT